jgi:hypothetical protein
MLKFLGNADAVGERDKKEVTVTERLSIKYHSKHKLRQGAHYCGSEKAFPPQKNKL